MLKYLSAVSAVLVLGAAPAFANGIYSVAANQNYAVYAPAQPWSGFFAGLNGGYAWKADSPAIVTTNGTDFLTSPEPDSSGGFGGGQIGYNWQRGAFVLGVAADLEGSGVSGSVRGAGNSGNVSVSYQNRQDIDGFGTVRGRAGYAASNVLFYVTGGLAYGEVTDKIFQAAGLSLSLKKGEFQAGFVVGGGFEYAFPPAWSVGLEYQRIEFGGETLKGPSNCACAGPYWSNDVQSSIDTVRFSLNYHFHSENPPVYKP